MAANDASDWGPILRGIQEGLVALRERLNEALPGLARSLAELEQLFGPDGKRVAQYLFDRGWSPSPAMDTGDLRQLVGWVDSDDGAAVDQFMLAFARRHAAEAVNNVIDEAPDRKDILLDALLAHQEDRYVLSVPVFLAQVDGICYDKQGTFLFSKYGHFKRVIRHHLTGSIVDAFLHPLTSQPKIARSVKSPGPILNRHMILHGRDTAYGTEENSLKAILLLEFLAVALH